MTEATPTPPNPSADPTTPATSGSEISVSVPNLPVVDAVSLFGGTKEIYLDYEGFRYRLRITRRGKLILQK